MQDKFTILDYEEQVVNIERVGNIDRLVIGNKYRFAIFGDLESAEKSLKKLNSDLKKGHLIVKEDVKLPLKIYKLDININIIPLHEPNNLIKFI